MLFLASFFNNIIILTAGLKYPPDMFPPNTIAIVKAIPTANAFSIPS